MQTKHLCVAHLYSTGVVHLFGTWWQISNLWAKEEISELQLLYATAQKKQNQPWMGRWKCHYSVLKNKGCLVFMQRKVIWTRERKYWLDRCYTVYPRKNAGNQTNDKGKKPNTTTTTSPGPTYLRESCDTVTFISAMAALVQTSVVSLVCWCTSAVLRSEKYHRMTCQVAFLSF